MTPVAGLAGVVYAAGLSVSKAVCSIGIMGGVSPALDGDLHATASGTLLNLHKEVSQ